MTESRLFGPDDFTRLRWKNGLGYTTELLREDLDAERFAWRLSIARVTEDGPFSDFDGYHRILLLLDGNGITLEHGDGSRQVLNRPLDAARFSGAGPTMATLHDGPIEDFNVMTCNGVCSARVYSGADTRGLAHAGSESLSLIYASREELAVSLDRAEALRVPPGHLLRLRPDREARVRIAGAGFIAVEIVRTGRD